MKLVLTRLGQLEYVHAAAKAEMIPDDCVQTEVLACAICRTDAKMWQQGHRDLVFPRVLGHEMVVRDGDHRYMVWPGKSCGNCTFCISGRENLCDDMKITGFHSDGGFASSAIVPKYSLISLPEDIDNHIACFGEPIGCVINCFEKIRHRRDDRILILGGGTMGLITALFSKSLGLKPIIIEKSEVKIKHIDPFLRKSAIPCVKETNEGDFSLVINCCGDHVAFCQGITKVAKGGDYAFFSGLSKNEHLETNLLNILHYKEAQLHGVYGMTRSHMEQAVPFIQNHTSLLRMLVEDVVEPRDVPGLICNVLSGKTLKYIVDHTLDQRERGILQSATEKVSSGTPQTSVPDRLCNRILASIEPVSKNLLAQAQAKIDDKTKPLGALGRLENLGVQICRIQETLFPTIDRKHLFVFAGDHGICEEGVSAYPSEVTSQMVKNFLNGGAAINVLCRHHDIDMKIVDMGVNFDFRPHPDLIDMKVAKGSNNFAIEDAMTREQMYTALENGMRVFVDACKPHRIDIVGLGEMGIGNTTSASAIISTITGTSPADIAGRGTGLDDEGLKHKIDVIERALEFHDLSAASGYDILQKIGGFEICGMTGAALAAASCGCCVVLDGVISTAAGLIAYTINPEMKDYLIAGHKSVEIAHTAALEYMGLAPLIDFHLRLGEGTGAALAIDMTDAACKIMCEMASFDEAKVARSKQL